jgi:hypothetical protein
VIGIEKVDADELRIVLKVLKQINPTVNKDLGKYLKTRLAPIAEQVASAAPQEAPLSGFANRGPTGYKAPKGKISFTPGKGRRNATNLLSIRVDAGKQRGFYIAELAGSRSAGLTNSGRALIEQLNNRSVMKGKGGRYAYKQFRFLRPDIVRIATEVVNQSMRELERMLPNGN